MTGPPLGSKLLSRLRFVRLGPEWKEWVEQDVARPSRLAWIAISDVFVAAAIAVLADALIGSVPVGGVIAYLVISFGLLLFPGGRRFLRQRDLEPHRRKWEREARRAPPAP